MRPPFLIAFDITGRCNLRCLHCYNDSGAGKSDMNESEIKTAVQRIIRLKPMEVCVCGGEPLLSPYCFDIIEKLRPNVGKLMMVSNGFLIDEGVAKRIVAAGMDSVQISLDGAYAYQHDSLRGVNGAFYRAVAAIRNLKNVNVETLSVAMILNKTNYKSLEDFFTLCEKLGADAVHIMQMLPLGRGENAAKDLGLKDEEIFEFCRDFTMLRPLYEDKFAIEWNDPVGSSKFVFNRSKRFMSPFSLSVRANGDVVTDPYFPFKLGNILENDFEETLPLKLAEVWNDAKTAAKVSRLNNVFDFEDML